MRKSMLFCVLLVLLSPLFVISQDQEEIPQAQMARVIADKANIYLESNPYSIVIDTVGRETIVTLFQTGKRNKKWLYISYYSKKRMAQVTGFIDINLVEIVNEKPKNPDPPQEANENSNEKLEQEEKGQAETESKAEKTQESQEEIAQANAEKELADMQKELGALRTRLKELEKESEKEPVEDVKKANMEEERKEAQGTVATATKEAATAQEEKELVKEESKQETEISQEQENVQETEQELSKEKVELQQERKAEPEEKKITEPVKQLIEKIQKENESVVNAQQMRKPEKNERTEENKVIAEKKDEETMDTDLLEVLTKVSIKVRMANIRLMPSLKSAVIHQLPLGVELKPLGKSGNWYRVNLPPNPDGIILSGYIHGSIVNETFEKFAPPPPEPEEFPEDEHEGLKEEPEPIKEIPPLVRTKTPGLPIWIGACAGYTVPSETNFGNSVNFGLILGYWINRYLAVELRAPYFQSDVTGSAGRLSTGRFKSISLTMSIQARYPIKDHIHPYVVGGGNYHLNEFTLDKEVVNSWNALGFNIEENVDHTFGFHFGGGLDYFLFRNLALNLDVRYYTASLTGKRHLADAISQEETVGKINNIKLNSLQASISVKFFLNR